MANTIQNKVAQNNQETSPIKGMQSLIKSMEGEIKKALPSVITPERFTRMVLSALSTTPKLAECTPKSFLAAMMNAAQLGLEIGALGHAYLIPYKNKGIYTCTFVLGYKGLIDLAYRSGEVSVVQAHIVYENDEFEYSLGLDPKLEHKPALKDRGEPILVYAMFKTNSGGYGFEVMSMDDCRRHAEKYSKAYASGTSPWTTNFEEMCKKTVLKRCLKYAPLKSDFVRAMASDNTVKNEISEDMYEVANVNAFETSYDEVDTETGEVTENGGEA